MFIDYLNFPWKMVTIFQYRYTQHTHTQIKIKLWTFPPSPERQEMYIFLPHQCLKLKIPSKSNLLLANSDLACDLSAQNFTCTQTETYWHNQSTPKRCQTAVDFVAINTHTHTYWVEQRQIAGLFSYSNSELEQVKSIVKKNYIYH